MISRLLGRLRRPRFGSSASYWDRRYVAGGNSGPGSYSHLASFKADVLNSFVERHNVRSVIEFGCGDGNQLSLASYPQYVGLDVSPEAVSICRAKFAGDHTKMFDLVDQQRHRTADLSLSLDVIFHLVEDPVFDTYMRRLFASGERFVGIYSSNDDRPQSATSPHVRHRRFTDWIATNSTEWMLLENVPNRYPDNGDNLKTSFSDFFFYARAGN